MKLILTGSSLPATDLSAYIPGLQVVPPQDVLLAAKQCAKDIAKKSGPVVRLAKQAIVAGMSFPGKTNEQEALTVPIAEKGLDDGFMVERDLYYSSFDLKDKDEGIDAFLEKRKPAWTHQ